MSVFDLLGLELCFMWIKWINVNVWITKVIRLFPPEPPVSNFMAIHHTVVETRVVEIFQSGPSVYLSACVREKEGKWEKERKRKRERDSDFSIDITDFTHQAPNCLNTLKETPCSNKAPYQQRLIRVQSMTDFSNCLKSFFSTTVKGRTISSDIDLKLNISSLILHVFQVVQHPVSKVIRVTYGPQVKGLSSHVEGLIKHWRAGNSSHLLAL